MQCQHEHEEAAGDGHEHHHNHTHNHEVEDADGDSLYPFIDTSKLRALNAANPAQVGNPFKPHSERQNHSRFLSSNDDDPQLIIFIPYV